MTAERFEQVQTHKIPELKRISQKPKDYLNKINLTAQSAADRTALHKQFITHFFHIWTQDQDALERPEMFVNREKFSEVFKKCYAENFYPWTYRYMAVNKNISFSSKNLGLKALLTENTYVLSSPTEYPCFHDPKQAGEGYPFDYNNRGYLYLGTPVRVLDFSKDKVWALVWTNAFACGWIQTRRLTLLSETEAQTYMKRSFGVVIQDRTPIQTTSGYSDQVFMCTILPTFKGGALLPRRGINGELVLEEVPLSKKNFRSVPFPWTKRNLKMILNQLVDTVYGWGSLNGNRDCSALIQSYFAVFGHHIPRNSTAQALKASHSFDLEKLSAQERKKFIEEKGVPFLTSVRMPGHVMLYVGTHPDYGPLFFHSTWGLKTQKGDLKGRLVIGRAVFTSGRVFEGLEKMDVTPSDYVDRLTHMMLYPIAERDS